MKNLLYVLFFCAVSVSGYAQQVVASGTVTDAADGSPLPGVTVRIQNSTVAALTDGNGKYTIPAKPGDVLTFSFVGKITQETTVPSSGNVNVALKNDLVALDEVVVMGYGVQKKKLVTGATLQVAGDDLQKLSSNTVLAAMQSQTPGVNILQTSGQPGEEFKVNIRGIGTIDNYDPLYVIDGVAGGNINNLNPSDIESIDVLKDAASAAIYGARAANGVVLITTKRGKTGEKNATISYDGYWGVQNIWKMATPLNAQQYMAIMDEIDFNNGGSGLPWSTYLSQRYYGDQSGKTYYDKVLDGTWQGTNWLDAIRNKNAPIQNHALNITGGTEKSAYSLGFSYAPQEGILGVPVQSDFQRYTFRVNSDYVLYSKDDRDIIKVGENLMYMKSSKVGLGIGDQYWNDISNALRALPIMPQYDEEGEYFDNDDKVNMGLSQYDGEAFNPVLSMVSRRGYNLSKNYALDASVYVQIQPVKGLTYRSQFGYRMSGYTYRSFNVPFVGSVTERWENTQVGQNMGMGDSFTWENTLNYVLASNNHHFDVLLGQSIEKSGFGEDLSVTNQNLSFNDFEHAYIVNTGSVSSNTQIGGSPWGQGALSSFFGRVNYDYKETYMLSLVMRADGSSNFARGHRWGYFPSVSAGWVLTNEDFMSDVTRWMDFFKLRGSWGQNGNCNIASFQYLATISFNPWGGYNFGKPDAEGVQSGGFASRMPNPDVTWETSEQYDLGFDARFLRSRLGVTFDWYIKNTKDWLVTAPILGAYGFGFLGAPYINGGDIRNTGVEFALNWRDNVSALQYGANVNIAYNKNEVIRIANDEGIIHGSANLLSQGTEEMNRVQVGYPIGYFYGYKTEGVFQNQAEIDAWRAAGKGILQPKVQPGDLKFSDLQPDGKIDNDDKTMIGDPNPKVRLGFGINLAYKGADFIISAYGAFGQQIAKSYRQFGDGKYENYTTEVYERWHGEGTSNKWPRLTAGNNINYMSISDIFIEDGDYLRLQNITLGYDFKQLVKSLPLGQLRLYVTAQNLWTFTGYSGMDPEVGFGGSAGWSSGIDVGFYPQPRTYLVGVNIKF
jgi:TonB-linked SusC/RagA family outer membrane protein